MQVNNRIIKHEIECTIKDLNLNLEGLTILTEAATGLFAYTPVIALMAGAKKVHAVCQNTQYGTIKEIVENTYQIIDDYKLDKRKISICEKHLFDNFSEIDIITNLGHVRPIDRNFIGKLKKGTVISYMAEPWEFRKADLDIGFCLQNEIPVYGTNEDHPKINCFRECGTLAIKLLIEAGISLYDTRIGIISRDKFGYIIKEILKKFTENIFLFTDFEKLQYIDFTKFDVLIIADYLYEGTIVGNRGLIKPSKIKTNSHAISIIQFCGENNIVDIKNESISVYPDVQLSPLRMSYTLAEASYKALIRLHAGGLKVGEGMIYCKKHNMSLVQTKETLGTDYVALSFE